MIAKVEMGNEATEILSIDKAIDLIKGYGEMVLVEGDDFYRLTRVGQGDNKWAFCQILNSTQWHSYSHSTVNKAVLAAYEKQCPKELFYLETKDDYKKFISLRM